jgi:hypothetical protein
MKNSLKIFWLLTALSLLIGCDECNCPAGDPFGELAIKLTINDDHPEVLVTIFEGNIEKADTLFSEYWSDDRVYYELESGRRYSATAHYFVDGREIVAIDGKQMTTSSNECDCNYGESITLNLRLAK